MAEATGYSRNTTTNTAPQPAAIIGLDLQNRKAKGLTRTKIEIDIDTSFAVGETIVTPAIGEQWYVKQQEQTWRLVSRIPFNDATLNVEPVEGQVSVGSAVGPLELNGPTVNVLGNVLRMGEDTVYRDNDGVLQSRPASSTDDGDWTNVVPPPPAPLASTDELPEGTTNLYYHDALAAAAAPVQSVAGRTGAVSLNKTDVGLPLVDNVADANKPVSTAQAAADAAVASVAASALSSGLSTKADLDGSGHVPVAQVPDLPNTQITGLPTSLSDLAGLLTNFQGLLNIFKGGSGGGLGDATSLLQGLTRGTGLFDASQLGNISGIPTIGSGSVTGLTGLLSNFQSLLNIFKGGSGGGLGDATTFFSGITPGSGLFDASKLGNISGIPTIGSGSVTGLSTLLTNFQNLLNIFKGGSGGGLGDATTFFSGLTPGTGLFDSSKLGNIANIPALADDRVPGVGNILDEIWGGINGFLNTGRSHSDMTTAVQGQTDALIGQAATVSQIAAALSPGNPDHDEFERTNTTNLDTGWTQYQSGSGAKLSTSNGHDAQFSINPLTPGEWVAYRASVFAAGDNQVVEMVFATVPRTFGANGYNDLWLRQTNFGSFAARTGLCLRYKGDGTYALYWVNAGTFGTALTSGTAPLKATAGTTWRFEAGVGLAPRRFRSFFNGTPIMDYTEGGTTSQYGASYLRRGFGGKSESVLVNFMPGDLRQWTASG